MGTPLLLRDVVGKPKAYCRVRAILGRPPPGGAFLGVPEERVGEWLRKRGREGPPERGVAATG